jgi:hypothetical protein
MFAALVLLAAGAPPGVAQQVPTEPASTHIFPAGGRRGSTVEVRVGGEFLPPYTRFRVFGPGVQCSAELVERVEGRFEPSPRRKPGGTHINYPREWKAHIEIAEDAAVGQRLWRVSSARGGSGGRPFLVGDLPECIEAESNSTPARAEPIELPVTLNGQIAGERDLDYFQFELEAGELLSIEMFAARLGSPIEPVIELQDETGRRLQAFETRLGSDPLLVARTPAKGIYRLLISNLGFQGGPQYVYRATVSTLPYVAFAFPSGGKAGDTATIELLSWQPDGRLRGWQQPVRFPEGPPASFRLTGARNAANYVTLDSLNEPPVLENEPNNAADRATAISLGATVYGRLQGHDEDWFAFGAQKDDLMTIQCLPVPMAGGFMPVVRLFTAGGAPLAVVNSIELAPRACRTEFRAPETGSYMACVRDAAGATVEACYRFEVARAQPDFAVTAAADIINVVQAGRAELDLKVERKGGFAAPLELTVEGLPPEVKAEPLTIAPGQESAKLAFVASEEARPADFVLTVNAHARLPDQTLTRVVEAAHLGHDALGVSAGPATIDHVQLTVRHKQVFRLFCSEAYQYAHRGTIYPYKMEVERLNGFEGPIQIEIADRQIMDKDGVDVVNSLFPAGVTEIMLPLYLPETMHINIQPHSNIYAQGFVIFEDKWGQRQSMLQVSEMRCMIRPLPTVARLRVREKSVLLAGRGLSCTLQLDRSSNFSGAMRVELLNAPPGVRCPAVTIDHGAESAPVTVEVDSPAALTGLEALRFRGTGDLPNNVKVVSEAEVQIAR